MIKTKVVVVKNTMKQVMLVKLIATSKANSN